MTWGELLEPGMEIGTHTEAGWYFERLSQYFMTVHDLDRDEALRLTRDNIGYFAGYYGTDVRARVEALFAAPHPILGSVHRDPPLTPEEIFRMGYDIGYGTCERVSALDALSRTPVD